MNKKYLGDEMQILYLRTLVVFFTDHDWLLEGRQTGVWCGSNSVDFSRICIHSFINMGEIAGSPEKIKTCIDWTFLEFSTWKCELKVKIFQLSKVQTTKVFVHIHASFLLMHNVTSSNRVNFKM